MLVVGATAAAAINFAFVFGEFLETGEPYSEIARFLEGKRWTAHVSDYNAAGSFYVFAALLSLSVALFSSTHPMRWAGLAFISGLAMWTTASRTAIVAFLAVGVLVLVTHALARPRWFLQVIGVAAAGLAALLVWRFPVQLVGSIAWEGVTFRWLFLKTTLRMIASEPIFGVGVGQYPMWSSRFIPAELVGSQYASENAHNNFAQIAGEMGLVGFTAFMGVLVISVSGLRHRRARADNPLALSVLFGLAAFIVTWLGGHPLLVPEVAYPFWMGLGVLAGLAEPSTFLNRKLLAATCLFAAVLLISIPWRVIDKENAITSYRQFGAASSVRAPAGS
jgi:O-antigen ligase